MEGDRITFQEISDLLDTNRLKEAGQAHNPQDREPR